MDGWTHVCWMCVRFFYIWNFMLLDFMFWIWDLEKVVDISCRDGILIPEFND